MSLNSLLADFVVVFHLGYVIFVVLGLVLILAGRLLTWSWVRNSWFRVLHLGMIGLVVVESLLSITCPLTTLESYLRSQAGQTSRSGSFMGRLAHEVLFFELTPEFFTIGYCLFGAVVLATFLVVPPNFMKSRFARRPSVDSNLDTIRPTRLDDSPGPELD